MSDVELLMELASIEEVGAWVPTGKDHDEGITPPWCELVLEASREGDWPFDLRLPLRRADGELIIEMLHQVLHPKAGGNVVQMLWAELDELVDQIQKRVFKGKKPKEAVVNEARGLAKAIAIMTNPFGYDVDAVRAEAMDRFEARRNRL